MPEGLRIVPRLVLEFAPLLVLKLCKLQKLLCHLHESPKACFLEFLLNGSPHLFVANCFEEVVTLGRETKRHIGPTRMSI